MKSSISCFARTSLSYVFCDFYNLISPFLFLQVWNLTRVASATDPLHRGVLLNRTVAKSTAWTSATLTNSAEIRFTSAKSAAIQRLTQANTSCISEKTTQTTRRLWSVTTDDSSNLMAGKQQRNKMSTCRGRDRGKKTFYIYICCNLTHTLTQWKTF